MKQNSLVDDLLRPSLQVAMPRAVVSAVFLTRFLPPEGRRRIIPVPTQIQAHGAIDTSGTFFGLPNGAMRRVEIHWYEAHGIGRRDLKIKRYLEAP